MKVVEKWGVLISQTGTEVVDISEKLGILPSLIITNNISKISQKNLEIFGKHGVIIRTIPFRPTPEHYLIPELLEKEVITLHGFLRILPSTFIDTFKGEIFNGHPALVNYYPELKGFNQQEAIYNKKEQYEWIGSIIHEVTEGVDEGKIYYSCARRNEVVDLDDMYKKLRETSLDTWIRFFKYEMLQDIQDNHYRRPESLHWIYGEES